MLVEILSKEEFYQVILMRPVTAKNWNLTDGSKYHVFTAKDSYVQLFSDNSAVCKLANSIEAETNYFNKKFFVIQ